MALLSLVLSAEHTPFSIEMPGGEGEHHTFQPSVCQFCGLRTSGWQGFTSRPRDLPYCGLCALPLNLNRPDIDEEGILIWLPEMSQAALNALVRYVHIFLAESNFPVTYDDSLAFRAPRSAMPAIHTYRTLHDRCMAAELRLGSSSPRQLGIALLSMCVADYAARHEMMDGLRLLSLGRFMQGGEDLYPDMVRCWQRDRATSP